MTGKEAWAPSCEEIAEGRIRIQKDIDTGGESQNIRHVGPLPGQRYVVQIRIAENTLVFDANVVESFVRYGKFREVLTPVFNAPPSIIGFGMIKGNWYAVVNGRYLMGFSEEIANLDEKKQLKHLILLKKVFHSKYGCGLLVDNVSDIYPIDPETIRPYRVAYDDRTTKAVRGVITPKIQEGMKSNETDQDGSVLYIDMQMLATNLIEGKIRCPVKGFYYWADRT